MPHGPVSAPITWDELPDVEMADFTIATMPARFAALGDVHAGIDDAVWDIEPLLEWAERDEQDRGLGDAPYPPNFPKQDGRAAARAAVADEQGELGRTRRRRPTRSNRSSSTEGAPGRVPGDSGGRDR